MGIYLSAHPLDEYKIVLEALCNTKCQELADISALAEKSDVTIGGIVTGVKSKFTKTGKPCGFVTVEDFEGSGEIALFGEEWGRWNGMLIEGSTECLQKDARFILLPNASPDTETAISMTSKSATSNTCRASRIEQ